jgi:hypothetical protein
MSSYSASDKSYIYSAPSLESTLLIETGGIDDVNSIGKLPSTAISAALSSGTFSFQYNRFFWNNEFFTFNYKNNSIGIAIAYYRNSTQKTYFAIYPIFLPRVAMTTLQSLQNAPTTSPEQRKHLLLELVYYLNMGFTSLGVGDNYGLLGLGSGVGVNYRIAPWVTSQQAKGSVKGGGGAIVDNPNFPIFQDNFAPPLLWSYNGNNGQLCLGVNREFHRFTDGTPDHIGFQLVRLEDYMMDVEWISDPTEPLDGFRKSNLYYGAVNGFTTQPINFFPDASIGVEGIGWCGQGAFATGFAQTATNDNPKTQGATSSFTYDDIYTDYQRRRLWLDTIFPVWVFPPLHTGIQHFLTLCKDHQLANTMVGSGLVISRFITSMIPFRFFSVESDSITRNQKRPLSSNNPNLSYNVVCLQFMTLDKLRTWTDNTVAGQSNSPGIPLGGSRKAGADDCSVVALDPMQSLQTLDLTLVDEWGNIIQNYAQLQSMSLYDDRSIMGFWDMFYITPRTLVVPAWVLAYKPGGVITNSESLLINESWWASVVQFYGANPKAKSTTPAGPSFAPAAPRSATLSHFGRVLGF